MRIIAGRLRGRDLGAVPAGVRPTSDRVRESLFGRLGPLDGCRVLDLFAGTGALGIEAFSRGAEGVVFVERSRRVAADLRRRIGRLGLGGSPDLRVLGLDATRAIRRLEEEAGPAFDLAFIAAPYASDDRLTSLDALLSSGLLAPGATVVVEGPKRHPVPPRPGARVVDERDYGDSRLTWLEACRARREGTDDAP